MAARAARRDLTNVIGPGVITETNAKASTATKALWATPSVSHRPVLTADYREAPGSIAAIHIGEARFPHPLQLIFQSCAAIEFHALLGVADFSFG